MDKVSDPYQKRSRNHYKWLSRHLQQNTPKLDAWSNATCSTTPPRMDPKIDEKSMKKHIWAPYGTTGPHYGLLGQALGVPHRSKMYQNRPKTCFRTRTTCKKTTTSENIPWETAVRKLTVVASLQLHSVLIKPLPGNLRWLRPHSGLIKPVSGNSQ